MSPKVLIVDDEFHVRNVMADALTEAGYEALIAENAEEGLIKLQQLNPDIVVSDVWMPGMNGYTFCQIARRRSNAAILMISGVPSEIRVLEETNVGADDVMVKPFDIEQFLDRIERLMQKKQSGSSVVPIDRAAAPASNTTPEEQHLLEMFRLLSSDERELVLRMIDKLKTAGEG